ncbi:MAG: hypothetical protein ABIF71_03470 [Planctomycetota bacterium]
MQKSAMLYYQPDADRFVGDCTPFWHDGVFHVFYLLDQGHHQGNGGLGGHTWAHVTTRDLRQWEHHPPAIGLNEPWEGSICTGSMIHHAGAFHAYYATRKTDHTQHLSHAVSTDGIHFTKTTPNPFSSAPAGYGTKDFRDPFAFADQEGVMNLLVTSRIEDPPLHDRGGTETRL